VHNCCYNDAGPNTNKTTQDARLTHSSLARFRALLVAGLVSITLLGGCATTGNPKDPLEPINRGVYQFNDTVDHLLLRPAAEVYRGVLPQVVRIGISNFFSNINDVLVALNNLLQGKIGQSASDVSRVVINTTVGILGFFDPATDMGFEKHNEDFGQTLGRWGFGDGPYIVLPFFGPSNLRDATGRIVDYRFDLVTYVDPSRDRNQIWALRAVNQRAELLGATSILETAALDPYEFLRDAYLQRRRNLVYDGNPPRDDEFDLKDEPRSLRPDTDPFPDATQTQAFVGTVWTSGQPETGAETGTRNTTAAPPEPTITRRIVRFWATDPSTGR
jgi:phospholipid-binding lipoprotein MlaA